MVGSPVVPRILSVPSSSVSLTVMYPDWFSSGPGFEKTYGFLKMVSGHPVVRLHHPEKGRQASECQCGSTGCIKAQPVASVCIGGDGGHLGDGDGSGWVGTLRLLGMGEGGSIIHITNSVLNFRRVFMARPVRLRTRRRESPSLNSAISSPYCIK